MGIHKLNDIINQYASDAIFSLPKSHFAGKRIAIDAYHFMYLIMSNTTKSYILNSKTDWVNERPNKDIITTRWLSSLINYINDFVAHGMILVFCFDGEHKPAKQQCQEKRKQSKLNNKAQIEQLRDKLRTTLEDSEKNIKQLKAKLATMVYIEQDQIEQFKMILKLRGIPCLTSVDEGERLCSMLQREGKVYAVMSRDTDCLAYGCNLLITKFLDEFECVRLDLVLQRLRYTIDNFVELCIMLGCDYNSNIKKIGVQRSKDLIDRFQYIDDLPTCYDTTILNFCNCRHTFATIESNKICKEAMILDYKQVEDVDLGIIKEMKLDNLYESINEMRPYKDCMHYEAERLEMVKIDDYKPFCTNSRDHICDYKQ